MVVYGSYDVLPRYVEETVFATIPSNPTFSWIDSATQNLDPTQARNSMWIWGLDQRRDPRYLVYMEKNYDYKVMYYPQDTNFLHYGFDKLTKSISLEETWVPFAGGLSTRYWRFLGLMVNQMRFGWKIGQPVSAEVDMMFADQAATFPDSAALAGVSYNAEPVSDRPFIFADNPITWDEGITGAFTSLNCTDAELRINNKRDRGAGFTIGQYQVNSLPLGRAEFEITVTRLFEDFNQVNDFVATTNQSQGTRFAMRFPFGTVANSYVQVVDAKWDPIRLPKDVKRDVLVYQFTAKGFQPLAGGQQWALGASF